VLIKSVHQSIPTYFMILFTLPSSMCDEIEKMMNSFWWGHSGSSRRGIHWMSWDKLSMHKNNGGMSFKSLGTFNLAMLGKQLWRIMKNLDTLISRIHKTKYFPRCNFLESRLGNKPSFVWRSICNAKFILKARSRWKIGGGTTISVWNNYWMKDNVTLYPIGDVASALANLRVSDCLSLDNKSWNLPFLHSIFNHQIVEHIVNTLLYPYVHEDKLIWRKENDGEYSVCSAYRLCMNELMDISHFKLQGDWNLIWKLMVPPKIKNLVWQICRICLPTRVRLRD